MSTIVVSVVENKCVRSEFLFDDEEQKACTVGRSSDCAVRVPNDFKHLNVSRRHCLLEIEPSAVWVRDLGSLNGTYLNEVCIGGRDASAGDDRHEVHNGDTLRIANTVLRVEIFPPAGANEPAACAACAC
jgi:pSer/pThr/pTyr-binding forkhead associated (FHA) protein